MRYVFRTAIAPLLAATTLLASPAASQPGGESPLRWLRDLGAESLPPLAPRTADASAALVVPVPGATYVFSRRADGALEARRRLAADPSAPFGTAVAAGGVVVSTPEGSLSRWRLAADATPTLQWQRELGERATSLGWDGGERVFAATWSGKLVALAAGDGRLLWATDIGGRAEAPPLVAGGDVLVATKARSLARLTAASGAVRWRVALPGVALHPPALIGDPTRFVLCGTWDGQLIAHDFVTGRARWSVTLPAKLAGPPLAFEDFVAAVTVDGTVHAYDSSGQVRWSQPGSSDGPATLLLHAPRDGARKLLVVSRTLAALDVENGSRTADYPKGAAEELKQRFADAMLDGVKTYSEGEKRVLLEQQAFEIAGPVFGPARLSAGGIAFGTEEGWAYLFDAARLRPQARYRAGQPCSAVSHAGGRIVAMTGEEIFALDATTGRVLWRRSVGPDARLSASDDAFHVVGNGRAQSLDPQDGVSRRTLRGSFRWAVPAASGSAETPWLTDEASGGVRAQWPSGQPGGEPLAVGGEVLPALPAGARSWLVATREGKVLEIAWEPPAAGEAGAGRLAAKWETVLDERVTELRLAGGRVFARTEPGSLVAWDESRQEVLRTKLRRDERFEVIPEAPALLVWGAADLRVHDWTSGTKVYESKTPAPVLAAVLTGTSLVCVDRRGVVSRMDTAGASAATTTPLGLPLVGAVRMGEGFLVTTAAGEVGRVDFKRGDAR
jgi:outer membrane protein assembly factor BamB